MGYWIVVVDDETISLTSVKSALSSRNMKISCLKSGRELLKFIDRNDPDLILLDVMMPDMDGFETLEALRGLEDKLGKPHIPVIFLTGDRDTATEQQGLELGASDFIQKSMDKEILIKRIENTISNTRTIESLTEEAMIDKLTGFLNKARGTERVSKLCGRKTGALMIMDLDNFKLVNDLFGHDMGDRVLEAFAGVIRNNTRETDTISRIGGDEFMAFYEDITDKGAVASLTLRLNTQLMEETCKLLGEDHGIPLGISIGVVMVPEYGRDYESLFMMADGALYTVKQNGKHGFHVHSGTSDREDSEEDPELKLERIIRIMEERNDRKGAFLLGSDAFASVYRFVMRFHKRYGGTAALLLFTLETEKDADNIISIEEACTQFEDILEKTLRVSDIIMRGGSDSFVIMLTERERSEAEGAIARILDAWKGTEHDEDIKITHVLRYMGVDTPA